jgi:hypothetical protein
MRKYLAFLVASAICAAFLLAPPRSAAQSGDTVQWRSGLSEIDEGWLTHDGDNPAWAATAIDDRAWQTVDLEELGPAQPGWHWFRKHIDLGPDPGDVRLLLSGGEGTYELFVNGAPVKGPRILTSFDVTRPIERVFPLDGQHGAITIALRTHAPANYHAYHLPLFLNVTLGQPTAIEYERQALESERLYVLLPSLAINLLLVLAGLSGLALFLNQRSQRDYLFLGLYLVVLGCGNLLWIPQQVGILPTSANSWIADPCIYLFTILQIEFTFSFARMRPGRLWRLYELALFWPLALIPFVWTGRFSFDLYTLIEAAMILPAGLLLPVLLFLWYRKGNREAGWLILPSLLPAVSLSLFNFGGAAASSLHWRQFAFLLDPIPIGPASLQTADLGNLVFLFAIGFVMFFRFTRVSREQARSAAELNAARQIQQQLVPSAPPQVAGFHLEAAYLPANEVGGDFYQVLDQPDGSTLLVVGDVSGKGLKAAMKGTLAIGAMRALAAEGLGPAELLGHLNREMLRGHDEGFITCLCVRLSTHGALTLANAGHLSPYVNGREVECDSGFPLGIVETTYAEITFPISSGDRVTFLSDGVVEAQNPQRELFGFARTAAIATQSATEIAQAAQAFGQEDDITVLTLIFTGIPAPLPV